MVLKTARGVSELEKSAFYRMTSIINCYCACIISITIFLITLLNRHPASKNLKRKNCFSEEKIQLEAAGLKLGAFQFLLGSMKWLNIVNSYLYI